MKSLKSDFQNLTTTTKKEFVDALAEMKQNITIAISTRLKVEFGHYRNIKINFDIIK